MTVTYRHSMLTLDGGNLNIVKPTNTTAGHQVVGSGCKAYRHVDSSAAEDASEGHSPLFFRPAHNRDRPVHIQKISSIFLCVKLSDSFQTGK